MRIKKVVLLSTGLATYSAVDAEGEVELGKCRTGLQKTAVRVCSIICGCTQFFMTLPSLCTSSKKCLQPLIMIILYIQNAPINAL